MSGLLISLKPNEKFLVNGAMLTNGPKRGQFQVGDDVSVLRMSDAIHPDEANTPLKRIYYAVQIILSCDAKAADQESEIQEGLASMQGIFENTPVAKSIKKAQSAAKSGRYYSLICALKPLLSLEDELLSRNISISSTVSNFTHDAPRVAMSA